MIKKFALFLGVGAVAVFGLFLLPILTISGIHLFREGGLSSIFGIALLLLAVPAFFTLLTHQLTAITKSWSATIFWIAYNCAFILAYKYFLG